MLATGKEYLSKVEHIMYKINIQVFAALKNYFEPSFELRSEGSIAELKKELERINPLSKNILSHSRFAVEENFVEANYKLKENDTIVVIPPSSGG